MPKNLHKSDQSFIKLTFSKMAGRGECLCRRGYVFWPLNGECYKAFTSGPCRNGQFLVPHDEDENIGKCVVNPCPRAHLYFPGDDFNSQIKCHKVRRNMQFLCHLVMLGFIAILLFWMKLKGAWIISFHN